MTGQLCRRKQTKATDRKQNKNGRRLQLKSTRKTWKLDKVADIISDLGMFKSFNAQILSQDFF